VILNDAYFSSPRIKVRDLERGYTAEEESANEKNRREKILGMEQA
jgi:hypothetical protein